MASAGWRCPSSFGWATGRNCEEYRDLVSKHLKFRYALLICIGIPSEIPGYLFGAVHYPFLKFVAAAGIAEFLYALGMVIAGEKLLDAKPYQLLFSVGAMVVVLVVAGFYVRRLRKIKRRSCVVLTSVKGRGPDSELPQVP